jgi:hypothetical protein
MNENATNINGAAPEDDIPLDLARHRPRRRFRQPRPCCGCPTLRELLLAGMRRAVRRALRQHRHVTDATCVDLRELYRELSWAATFAQRLREADDDDTRLIEAGMVDYSLRPVRRILNGEPHRLEVLHEAQRGRRRGA